MIPLLSLLPDAALPAPAYYLHGYIQVGIYLGFRIRTWAGSGVTGILSKLSPSK